MDASVVASSSGGTRSYAIQLLQGLVAARPDWRFVLYLRTPDDERELGGLAANPNVRTRLVPGRPNAWRVHGLLPRRLKEDRVDVYHSLGYFLPLRWRGPKIVTVHDLNVFFNARNWLRGPTLLRWLDLVVQSTLAIRAADRVITDSESSRGQICRLLRLRPSRVAVIPLAADPYYKKEPAAKYIAAARAVAQGHPYVLFVGILSPQKNLLTLIRAYARSALPGQGVRLVLAGSDREGYGRDLGREASWLGVGPQVLMPGFVSRELLSALYHGALCVVLPSHGEGFGLPLVEAMAAGRPILAANRQAIPEVLGDAGSLFEPDDVGGLARLLDRIGEDEDFREDLARRARQRLQWFSWEKTVAATAAVYEELVSSRR